MRQIFLALLLVLLASPAWAKFPVVAATAVSTEESNTTTHDVTLPSGISSGHLLLCTFGWYADSGSTPTVSGMPGGWTQLDTEVINDGGIGARAEVWYKVAAGGESNFTYTLSLSQGSVNRCWRITGQHASSAPESTSAGLAAGSDPDSPSLAPSWGTADTLWFSIAVRRTNTDTLLNYPTNYTDNQNLTSSAEWNSLMVATRNTAQASQNPLEFNWDASQPSVAFTVGIRPADAAAASRRQLPIIFQ